MDRNTFIKHSLRAGALILLGPLADNLQAQSPQRAVKDFRLAVDLLKQLLIANDKEVENLLLSINATKGRVTRKIGYDFAALSASYCSPGSKYYHSPLIVPALDALTRLLFTGQSEDGTMNLGNLESPPDTAFLLEPLSAGAFLLVKDNSKDLSAVNADIKRFIVKCGNALITGGVHTPNHRWVVCAALARLNALYPNQKYLDRIEDWLGEGIYIDTDGHFPERSQNYANVENNSLITLGRLLNRPEFFAPARKNLDMTWYYTEPNGDLVTTDSRRQDQYSSKNIVSFYLHYRYLAIRDKNNRFAAITRFIETLEGFGEEIVKNSLFHFLEDPLLQGELPADAPLPVDYEKLFITSHLLRIRRGNTTTTLFGGADWPITIASGRSNSPNIYSYRKGKAVLNYLRLSTDFFSMGYFYSDGLKKDGNKYLLHKKLDVPYYQPLPKGLRKRDGDYTLSPSIDDRFWNKMDFKNRPVSNVKTLDTTVSLTESHGINEITFAVTGQSGVQVTIELCFKEGGRLSGVTEGENGNGFLQKEAGKYEFEGDTIQFGPGTVAHKTIRNLEGERYSTHFGSLRTEGMHVYLTGVTPFNHKLTFS